MPKATAESRRCGKIHDNRHVRRDTRRSAIVPPDEEGLRSTQSDWIDLSRGLGEEQPDRDYNATMESAMHEMAIRAQYKAWLHYMSDAV